MMVRLVSKKRFFVIFGGTDLRMSLSGAKFDAEADFEVRSAIVPPKAHQIDETTLFRSENFAKQIRRGLWPTACRAYVYVLPTLRFHVHFLWVPANTQKVAGFAASADFGVAQISPQVDVWTVKNPKMSSKRRTDLKI